MGSEGVEKSLFSRIWLISCFVLLIIVAIAGWFVTGYLGDKARQEIIQYNESKISFHSSRLTAKFDKVENAIRTMSGYPGIVSALISTKEQDIANANSVLDRYSFHIENSVCYFMDSNGKTVASSNRNDSDRFVGKSYEFHPYFTQAIQRSLGRYLSRNTGRRNYMVNFGEESEIFFEIYAGNAT